jgi:hypothetical protein
MSNQIEALVRECRIQAESCQYTSTGLFLWLHAAKWHNRWWNALPIVFGATASFALLQQNCPSIASILALLAGLLPAIYEKLNLESHTEEIFSQAGQYKNLEHRFRQAAEITFLEGEGILKSEFAALMRQMEDLRARPIILPEKYFQAGRAKIKAGHYKPDKETISYPKTK